MLNLNVDDQGDLGIAYLREVVEGTGPQDPLERMLIQQLVWCQQRIVNLSRIACKQKRLDKIRLINEANDKAMNAFRRGMLALREYRVPHRQVSFTAVKQLNQAEQQNVLLAEKPNTPNENATNELGPKKVREKLANGRNRVTK